MNQTYDFEKEALTLGISPFEQKRLINLQNDENERFLILAILTFSENEIIYLALINTKDKEISNMIISRLSKMKLSDTYISILLSSLSNFIRAFAVSLSTLDQILSIAHYENNSLVAEEIVESFQKFNITNDTANTLLNAKSYLIRQFAIKYASKIEIICACINEENPLVSHLLVKYLRKKKISQENANYLINAISYEIREFASLYATSEILVNRAMIEIDDYVINCIKTRLISQNIKTDVLINAISPLVREFSVDISSDDALIQRACIEENISVLDKIMKKLSNGNLQPSKANLLINIELESWRAYIVSIADKNFIIKRALIEESPIVLKNIILRLEKFQVTQYEQDMLLEKSLSHSIRLFAVKNASKKAIINAALVDQSSSIYQELLKRLCLFQLTKDESDRLLNSKSHSIRMIAIKNATNGAMLKLLRTEKELSIISSIFEHFDSNGIPQNEADSLIISAKSTNVILQCLRFVSKNALIAFSIAQSNILTEDAVIKKLMETELTDDEATNLLFASSLEIAKIAADRLGSEKISLFLKNIYR